MLRPGTSKKEREDEAGACDAGETAWVTFAIKNNLPGIDSDATTRALIVVDVGNKAAVPHFYSIGVDSNITRLARTVAFGDHPGKSRTM